jgi:hypothetical protein
MDFLSARRQRLWEAMESCRSGSDDLSDPQFADLATRLAEDPELRGQFQRLQQADGAIQVAFANVTVHAGLADRVSRLLAGDAGSVEQRAGSSDSEVLDCGQALVAITPAETSRVESGAHRTMGRFSRRRLLVGFAAISAAAALLVAVFIQTHRPQIETPTSVCEKTRQFFGQEENHPIGELVSQVAPPVEFPMSNDIVRLSGVRWRHVESFPAGSAVAYDLPPLGGRATLYVVQANVPDLPSMPPACLTTGGKSAAAWQVGDVVYILVVEGDAGTYSKYLDQWHGPLT